MECPEQICLYFKFICTEYSPGIRLIVANSQGSQDFSNFLSQPRDPLHTSDKPHDLTIQSRASEAEHGKFSPASRFGISSLNWPINPHCFPGDISCCLEGFCKRPVLVSSSDRPCGGLVSQPHRYSQFCRYILAQSPSEARR